MTVLERVALGLNFSVTDSDQCLTDPDLERVGFGEVGAKLVLFCISGLFWPQPVVSIDRYKGYGQHRNEEEETRI